MGGLIKLTPENFELLGGKVDALIEKWKLQVSRQGRDIGLFITLVPKVL